MQRIPPAFEFRQGPRRAAVGFSLVELIATLLLISVAVLGISYALAFAFSHQSDGFWQARTVALAESYLEEIMGRRFDEATPLGGVPPCSPATTPCSPIGTEGESRANFDDVDDYHGLDEQPPRDADGNVRPGYDSYRVQIDVSYADAAMVTALGLDDATDAKRILVRILPPDASPLEFSVLRTNF